MPGARERSGALAAAFAEMPDAPERTKEKVPPKIEYKFLMVKDRVIKLTPLSHSLEDYLEAIYLIGMQKKVVRVKEVADFLDVKMPSVVDAISKLTERDLVSHEKYGYLNLTKKGHDTAKLIYRKHEEVFRFLSQFLGMDEETASRDACDIEHYISKNTLERIIKLMKFLDSEPEGYPGWLERFKAFTERK